MRAAAGLLASPAAVIFAASLSPVPSHCRQPMPDRLRWRKVGRLAGRYQTISDGKLDPTIGKLPPVFDDRNKPCA